MARKRRRAPVSTDKRFKRQTADMGTAERWQHSGRILETTERAGIFAARATEEHALDKLLLLKIIDETERTAGLRLFEDYTQARIEERVVASYNPSRGAAHDPELKFEREPAQEAAYTRWRKALQRIATAQQNALIHVCCCGHLPATQHLPHLKAGLKILCRYYGLTRFG